MQNQRETGVIDRWHFEKRFGSVRPTSKQHCKPRCRAVDLRSS